MSMHRNPGGFPDPGDEIPELQPCAHCGSEAQFKEGSAQDGNASLDVTYAICKNRECGARSREVGCWETSRAIRKEVRQRMVATAWNRRVNHA